MHQPRAARLRLRLAPLALRISQLTGTSALAAVNAQIGANKPI
jgi:hypothetical protein